MRAMTNQATPLSEAAVIGNVKVIGRLLAPGPMSKRAMPMDRPRS